MISNWLITEHAANPLWHYDSEDWDSAVFVTVLWRFSEFQFLEVRKKKNQWNNLDQIIVEVHWQYDHLKKVIEETRHVIPQNFHEKDNKA